MQLTLAWWNTALSPTKRKNRGTPEEIGAAAAVIGRLIQAGADLVALCEVTDQDLAGIERHLTATLDDFVIRRTQDKVGSSHFDTAVLHRKCLSLGKGQSVARHQGARLLKAAQKFLLSLPDGSEIVLYVSHWPSRATLETPSRTILGDILRGSIEDEMKERPACSVVLLGDFNDEPFDPVMEQRLLSSRDKQLVKKKDYLLYNPFWRHMTTYRHGAREHQFCDRGTYFHANGPVTKWRTFDQMMFSASLVSGKAGWQLDETATRVFDDPEMGNLVLTRKNVFDHLPIVGRLISSISDE
ncbi:hypothetical protein CDN99_02940 [Roseateles aquatilis]|uniref:Endonuclease/exonuclease/phosphatase domain-containing protein n=1 Tax=Roseateles aquatilis TaxID=431061 RepID=A0A246JLB7_9BURK|nr:endonuclease/exonuclease/phosphatase family protein [Roseateles aquatilis]OWQ93444.1 hypothetical protein CDN99_02940 [Roseateles aquatilis]